ncbi:aspartyl/glutamyl-tRNA(Asn/Gln) amidotransferase subunit B [Natronincola peptidivorans]|uniref:Aspartyl/glutamyl-tRNA(Asn/Gln) amidotransferase subunit B n=1 Tax=Natronincola peptidivorans TaxID=426128 RepID=A0A1I0BW05_9FIRM|nr:Asp-tRNA(Asn)/Glu-tRNA(Gln) amidotransferase subunit GatB [Natronincola peptidivorans]SET10836.1 aspartyl/glutamyl-tRNA(Asn/Gln) amidotransferase subunit B [Natronincola peptidivorans]
MAFETIIGLEIHVELETKSKIFCTCSTTFGKSPNENTCPICTGMPGTLPVLNEEAVSLAVKAGKALNCTINTVNKFDRKNYFYPDLPKAYQISQFDLPICSKGYVDIDLDGKSKRINITRIHMEEDAGKLIHLEDEPISLVDYNRTGVPLIEIVTEPDLRSPEEAVVFLKALRGILKYGEVSDCRMEQGSLRCDANISIREVGSDQLNTRVEIKNLNSFKEVLKALQKEEKRQRELYQYKEEYKIQQETRKWDAAKGKTIPMRSKEESHDYRYFPEPDLKPIFIERDFIEKAVKNLPELPAERKKRIMESYSLKEKQVDILIGEKELVDYFEEVLSYGTEAVEAANWITIDLLRVLKDIDVEEKGIPIKASNLAKLIELIGKGVISRTAGREIFDEIVSTGKTPEELVEEKGLSQISNTEELEKIAEEILKVNPQAVEDFHKGKGQALGYIMGQTMKATKGKANPQLVKEIIEKKLKKFQI